MTLRKRPPAAWPTAAMLGLATLLQAGCALEPAGGGADDLAGLVVPAQWSQADAAQGAGPNAAAWWTRFDDLALTTLVERARLAHTGVRTAQAVLAQAQALRDGAAAALWPALGANASAQRGRAAGQSTGNRFQVGADANWALDVFGANRQALAATDATALAAAASLADARSAIAAEVGLSYLLLRSTQARTAIAEDNLASQQATLQIARWRLEAGLVTALEADQALAATAQTRALLPALAKAQAQTIHALAVLTGQTPGNSALAALLATPARLPGEPGAVSGLPILRDPIAPGLPANALRQRADVRAAEWRVRAAMARVSQAEAARYPSFALGGSLGLSAATLGALTQGASVLGSVLASASVPLFDAGANTAQVQAQEAALAQAHVAYQAAVLAALSEVEDALVALRTDRQRVAHLQAAAQAARRAAALARQRFGSGLIDFQPVLDTQRAELSSQDGVASATADVAADQVRLFRALGGGLAEPTGTVR